MALSSLRINNATVLWIICFWFLVKSQVVEIDESFQEKKQNFAWLLKFYAPWCGHCKRLEPTYHQVYLGLKGSPIIVAKVDATKYPGIASAYDVRGYPSIKFIQGNKVINYNGDRTKENIIEFARKAFGPSVQLIKSTEQFFEVLRQLSQNVFFTYVSIDGNTDAQPDFINYKRVAEMYAISSSFYLIENHSLPENTFISKLPSILVWKDDQYLEFRGTMDDFENWVKAQRFSTFPAVGGMGLNEMSSLDKNLIIYVHTHHLSEWYDIVKQVAHTNRNLQDRYQFVWLKDVDVGNNIIMSNMEGPFIFIFNSSDHSFFQYPFDFLSKESFMNFIENVENGIFKASGGKGWLERIRRLIYDIVTTMNNIYKESPWLSLLIFGVPLFIISVIFYTLCCIEPIEDAVYEDFVEDVHFRSQDGISEEMKKLQ